MRKIYVFIIICLCLNFSSQAQTFYGFWAEDFESMVVNQSPSQGWLSPGTFSVMPSPHGFAGSIGLSLNLNSLVLSDSVFSPKITGANGFSWYTTYRYRICYWVAGNPSVETLLSTGDTCYIYLYKYTGSIVNNKILLNKIHAGNHSQTSTLFNHGQSYQNMGVNALDTFRIVIIAQRGLNGDYWYDFDNFQIGPTVNIAELNNPNVFNIFPNPSREFVTVISKFNKQKLSIYNVLGALVFTTELESEKVDIDISRLSNGVYFFKLGEYIQKVIKGYE